ncbi:MAG: DUF1329 domain-containing protein [Pseudomonadales bacterium]|nr:DUF1329 domain-containing protein [Halioglobus sp.]MCP5127959.1 DUF1329 domain-containing protein [Pseudomonadales bacterium]
MHHVSFRQCLLLTLLAGQGAQAAVSPEDAARLGKTLTPMGAEMAGNEDGSIPPWDPVGTPVPANFVPGSDNYVDPYADEKPLYTINANNWEQYAEFLTVGTKAMFEKYGADGWEMHVYPTHRGTVRPDWFYANTLKNATGATLVADGQKIEGSYPGVPFPIPQSGLEVMWNHMVRYAEPASQTYDTYYVDSSGNRVLATSAYSTSVYPMFTTPDEPVGEKSWTMLRINYDAPARRAGEILLVHEPGADYTEGKGRSAWQYLTGQRRVRLAPAVSFDTPNPGVAGTSTYDDSFIYNGSPERFNWHLVGKREIIIPASSYKFVFESKLEDALGDKFLKPEYIRWEKHRVWVVDSTLKEGQRHLYSRRTFYLDEDSWVAAAGEMYDGRGQLWRLQYLYGANLYDRKTGYGSAYGAYDLLQNIYNLNGKLIPGRFRNGVEQNEKYFTPKGMARGGVR